MDSTGPFGKTVLTLSEDPPLCPWCAATLTRIRWHKVHGGPSVPYMIVLSCERCRAVLDCLAGGSESHGS
jgi:hypothetical protein